MCSCMGLFDFLKGKSKPKPHIIMGELAEELKGIKLVGKLGIADEACNQLENYLAAACAGTTATVYVKRPPKADEVERCLNVAESSDIMMHIADKVSILEPETRRIVSAIWGYLLKVEHPKSFQRPMVEYLTKHVASIDVLLDTYGKNGGATDVIVGVMIRDAARFLKIIEYIFKKDLVFSLFSVLTSNNFDVSSDAFQTLREMLTNHKEVSAPWLSRNFDRFFSEYMKLLSSEAGSDYVTVRQALSILATILLDRQFMEIMINFVGKEDHLKRILILLGNPSKVVQFEAFHIFKIFAANPNKTPKVIKILSQNTDRIYKLLNQIEQDRPDDNEFRQDKNAVVTKMQALRTQPANIAKPGSAKSSATSSVASR